MQIIGAACLLVWVSLVPWAWPRDRRPR